MAAPSGPPGPLFSEFASDPDMGELVQLFVSELPERVEALRRAWSTGEVESLSRLSHQLRGASPGYGFPTLGASAERLELALKQLGTSSPGTSLETVAEQYKELVDLCQRVRHAT